MLEASTSEAALPSIAADACTSRIGSIVPLPESCPSFANSPAVPAAFEGDAKAAGGTEGLISSYRCNCNQPLRAGGKWKDLDGNRGSIVEVFLQADIVECF